MAKLVKVHSTRAMDYLAVRTPDGRPDYSDLYKELRAQASTHESRESEAGVEEAVKELERAYTRLKRY